MKSGLVRPSFVLVLLTMLTSTAGACPFHGFGEIDESTGDELRNTLVIRLTDHFKQTTKGFVPENEKLTLPETGGHVCTVGKVGLTTGEEIPMPVYEITCRTRQGLSYELRHDCGRKNSQLPEKMWTGQNSAGMAAVTVTVDCM